MDYKTSLFILIISTTTFISAASAVQCFSPSPDLLQSGDSYYDLDTQIKLTASEKKQIRTLYRLLKGRWEGTLDVLECKGSDKHPRPINKKAEVTASTKEGLHNNLVMRVENYYRQERMKRSDRYDLFDERYILNISHEGNVIEGSQKYRIGGRYRSSLVERVSNIITNNHGFVFTSTIYTNGYLTKQEIYRLHEE